MFLIYTIVEYSTSSMYGEVNGNSYRRASLLYDFLGTVQEICGK
jgi:hypothetical protein